MERSTVSISRLGQASLVLDVQGELSLDVQRRIWVLAREARTWPGVRETVPGMNNLTLVFEWKQHDADELASRLRRAWDAAVPDVLPQRAPIEIPVRYGGPDGPDLAYVAARAGMSEAEVVARHTAAEYVVYFLGFRPGFAYLGGLDPRLATPRRAHPRPRVAPGSVGIGGEQTAVYPLASPGGWQLIGRTRLRLFDPNRTPPTLLMPGDVVRFSSSTGLG
jgi:KipI family sensor histidine kinase inhibitor